MNPELVPCHRPECKTCIHVLADHTPCDTCLTPRNEDGSYPYKNYKRGTIHEICAERHRQELAGRNIVLGREGEHCVSANWTIEQTRAKLSDCCNAVGGLSWREGDVIVVDKPYEGGYKIEFVDGKLTYIYRETRRQPKKLWWSRHEVIN